MYTHKSHGSVYPEQRMLEQRLYFETTQMCTGRELEALCSARLLGLDLLLHVLQQRLHARDICLALGE